MAIQYMVIKTGQVTEYWNGCEFLPDKKRAILFDSRSSLSAEMSAFFDAIAGVGNWTDEIHYPRY